MPEVSEAREFYGGMGEAVARRTILRRKEDNSWETWGDVAKRVAKGNAALISDPVFREKEREVLHKHLANATILMSGRHLQHGDETQPERNLEVFSNCMSASSSFALFYNLMNGAGVGRCYDDSMMLVDWDNAPSVRCVLSHEHPDFDWSAHESARDALHKYGHESKKVMWFRVPDTREGWAQALEILENAAFEKIHREKMLILDFSDVREKGAPIRGMQGKPASGPVPLMNAFNKAAALKGAGLEPWRQAMYVDHYFAECVLVGGARRAARLSMKFWKDLSIIDFIHVKRPVEFYGKSIEEVIELRKTPDPSRISFLWSSNNSVGVDSEFWELISLKRGDERRNTKDAIHARKVWKELTSCAYGDGTGEPGIVNLDMIDGPTNDIEKFDGTSWLGSKKYQVREETIVYLGRLMKKSRLLKYQYTTNPCVEIRLHVNNGACIVGDVVPFHAETIREAIEAFRVTTRALIRINTMDSFYHKEIKRTNRIGVGITGIHEFAWKFFRIGFKDIIKPDFSPDAQGAGERSASFWKTIERFRDAVIEEAESYSKELGLVVPHTSLTVKPAGTTGKIFGLTEGWHLPPHAFYLRWVQFRNDDPLIKQCENNGFPVRKLNSYQNTTIVGFPTAPVISTLEMGDELVCSNEATVEEQYEWLRLGEKHWLGEEKGNQISYTLHYDPEKINYKEFCELMKKNQSTVRACSVMPREKKVSYEYVPEQTITKAEYEQLRFAIKNRIEEEVDRAHVDCATGACPIDFNKEEAAVA